MVPASVSAGGTAGPAVDGDAASAADGRRRQVRGTSQVVLGRRAAVGTLIGLSWAAVARQVRGAESAAMRPPGAAAGAQFEELCLRCGSCIRACPAGVLSPDLGEIRYSLFLQPGTCVSQRLLP